MELYFLRHADAGERDHVAYPDDSKRPLSADGILEMRRSAKSMKKAGLDFDRVFSSPYVRARQTAQVVVREMGWKGRIDFFDGLTPEASFDEFSKILKDLPESSRILFVGHEPSLSHFVASLIAPDFTGTLKKGGMAYVEYSPTAAPGGRLKWLLTPEEILRLP